MWTLFVINMAIGYDEIKFTRYANYKSEWDCNNAVVMLEKEFKKGEKAVCFQTMKKPKGVY